VFRKGEKHKTKLFNVCNDVESVAAIPFLKHERQSCNWLCGKCFFSLLLFFAVGNQRFSSATHRCIGQRNSSASSVLPPLLFEYYLKEQR
jgi:hypothetical protein